MPKPQLSKAKNAELLAALAHPNGWWRDTAQRLLVERNDINTVPQLKASSGRARLRPSRFDANNQRLSRSVPLPERPDQNPRALDTRRDARLDPTAVKLALNGSGPHVRGDGHSCGRGGSQFAASAGSAAGHAQARRRHESDRAAPTRTDAGAKSALPASDEALRTYSMTARTPTSAMRPSPACGDASWNSFSCFSPAPIGRMLRPVARMLSPRCARAVTSEANPKRVNCLARRDRAAERRESMAAARRCSKGSPSSPPACPRRPIKLTLQPAALGDAEKSKDTAVTKELGRRRRSRVARKARLRPPAAGAAAHADAERTLPRRGKSVRHRLRAMSQARRHGTRGTGAAAGGIGVGCSDREERCIRIVLNGVRGPITVNGEGFNLEMPNLATLSDEQIAGALTFVRRSWDNDGSPIEPETVSKIRKETQARAEQWTERELLRMPPSAPRDRSVPSGGRSTTQRAAPSTRPHARWQWNRQGRHLRSLQAPLQRDQVVAKFAVGLRPAFSMGPQNATSHRRA